VERVRKRIAPLKGGPEKWLEVMEAAHAVGMKTTGTMMFGITETLAERVEHFRVLREQQDRALARANGGGHTAFVAWPFQSGNTVWAGKLDKPTDAEYLRTIAVAGSTWTTSRTSRAPGSPWAARLGRWPCTTAATTWAASCSRRTW